MSNNIYNYKIVTVTHKTSSLRKLGDFAIPSEGEALQLKLEQLKANFDLDELMYLSTCNRVMYLFSSKELINKRFLSNFLPSLNPALASTPEKDIFKQILVFDGPNAVRHLYEVAASIDSLVIGEREILRQLRDAFAQAGKWNLVGDNLKLLMRFVVTSAKAVYANTRIAEKPISVVSLAIQKLLMHKISRRSRVLLVGAGQTNVLVSKFLLKHEYHNVTTFNRTLTKAEKLVKKFKNGVAYPLDILEKYNKGFDILIVCTGAKSAIIDNSLYEKLLAGETDRKLVIDLSIPNNVGYEVVKKQHLTYIEIEDLKALAKQNMAFREREVSSAQALLLEKVEDFKIHFQQRQIELAMKDIPIRIKAIKQKAIDEVFKKDLEQLDDKSLALMERMMTYMEKKCISIPMKVAKKMLVEAS